jgi:Tol biopolymer transport system component
MNEPEIRQRLFDLADNAPKGATVPPQLLRRARRRAALTLASSAAIVLALVAGGIFGVRSLRTSETQPAVRPSPTLPELRRGGEIIDVRRGNVVAVDPGTGTTRILVGREKIRGRNVGNAAWSPDGRWLAYDLGATGATDSEANGLWVTSLRGEPRQLMSVYGVHATWAWSPTEAQLATMRPSTDGFTLILIDPSTGRERNLGDIPGLWAWSPDGTRIVYGAPGGSIYSVDVDSGEHSLLAKLQGSLDATHSSIDWSPDGAYIAIVTPSSLYVMNADGSGVRLVHDNFKPGAWRLWTAVGHSYVAWSPDGTRLAYANHSGPDERKLEIWTFSLDDASPSLLVSHTNSESRTDRGWPQWSPDGSHIAFETDNSHLVIAADGRGGARTIDELTYRSWRGSWYFCYCLG